MAGGEGRKWIHHCGIYIIAKEPVDLAKVKETCEGLLNFGRDDYLPDVRRSWDSAAWPLKVWSGPPIVWRWVKEALVRVAEEIAEETGLPLCKDTKDYLSRLRSKEGQLARKCLDVASHLAIECGHPFWQFDHGEATEILGRLRKFPLPYPDTPERLFTWTLRFGRLMAAFSGSGSAPRHEQLLVAAKWAIGSLRRFHVSIPPELELKATLEVSNQIVRDQSAGIRVSSPVVMWCEARQRERAVRASRMLRRLTRSGGLCKKRHGRPLKIRASDEGNAEVS